MNNVMQSENDKLCVVRNIETKNIFDLRTCCFTCSKIKNHIAYDLLVCYNELHKVYVHKKVLKEGSLYFDSMLTYFKEKDKSEISINFEKPFEIFIDLLWYFYTDSIEVNKDNVEDIISTACFFQVNEVIEKCISVLKNQVNVQQAHSVWRVAKACGVEYLKLEAQKYLLEYFETFLNNKKFYHWSFDLVYAITKSDDLHVSEENSLWLFIKEWILNNCDKGEEEEYLELLIPNLRVDSNELNLIFASLEETKSSFNDISKKMFVHYHGSNGVCKNIVSKKRSFTPIFWVEEEFDKEKKSITKIYKFDWVQNNFLLLALLGENMYENIVSTYTVCKNKIFKFGCWNFNKSSIEYSSTDCFNNIVTNKIDSYKPNLNNATHFSCICENFIYLFCDFNSEKLKLVLVDSCENTSRLLPQNLKINYYVNATAASDNISIFLLGTELLNSRNNARKCKMHILKFKPKENKWHFPYSWVADFSSYYSTKVIILGAKLLIFKLDFLYIYDIESKNHTESKHFHDSIRTKLEPFIQPDTAISLDSVVRSGHTIILLFELNDYHFNFNNHKYIFVKFSASEVLSESSYKSMTIYCKTIDNDIKCHIIS